MYLGKLTNDTADLVEVENGIEVNGERTEAELYKVIQAHTTQADWTPDATPALYTDAAEEALEIITGQI